MEIVRCALCGSTDKKVILETKDSRYKVSQDTFRLVKCISCGLVYLNPRPTADELTKFYPDDYYSLSSRLKGLVEKWFTKMSNFQKARLVGRYKKRGRILDIGCGTGDFLHSLDPKGWEKFGIEPNSVGYKIAQGKGGVNMEQRKLIDCEFPTAYFDVVTMWHVLEHIPDQNETLEEVKRILKPDGILFLSSPNVDSFGFRIGRKEWFHLDLPRHLYLYESNSIRKMLSKWGFNVGKISFPVFEYPCDLFHSLDRKLRSAFLRIFFSIPLFIFALVFKPITSLLRVSDTIEVIARRA